MKYKDGWIETTLAEISIDNKGSYGIAASAVDYSDDLYTYLRITDISEDGLLNTDGLKSLTDAKAENYILQPNDIVFARTGNSTGKSYFYEPKDGTLVYAGFLIKFSLDPQRVNPKFIRYYTLSREYKGWVDSFSTGSTRGNINAKTYGDMKITLPPRDQQNFLVKILDSLEEKMNLNNTINKKLEEIAQAIFKQWFVDFEFPNEEGKPYKSSGGAMLDSELGMIPEGWEVKDLKSVGFLAGKNKDVSKLNESVPYIGLEHMPRGSIALTSWESSDKISSTKTEFKKGDILFGKLRPYFKKVGIAPINGVCSTDVLVLNSIKKEFYSYLTCLVSQDKFIDYCNATSTGTRMPRTGWKQMSTYKIVIPPIYIAEQFNVILKDSLEFINNSIHQNNHLKGLRDTLLPKLMSGEIRVPLDKE